MSDAPLSMRAGAPIGVVDDRCRPAARATRPHLQAEVSGFFALLLELLPLLFVLVFLGQSRAQWPDSPQWWQLSLLRGTEVLLDDRAALARGWRPLPLLLPALLLLLLLWKLGSFRQITLVSG